MCLWLFFFSLLGSPRPCLGVQGPSPKKKEKGTERGKGAGIFPIAGGEAPAGQPEEVGPRRSRGFGAGVLRSLSARRPRGAFFGAGGRRGPDCLKKRMLHRSGTSRSIIHGAHVYIYTLLFLSAYMQAQAHIEHILKKQRIGPPTHSPSCFRPRLLSHFQSHRSAGPGFQLDAPAFHVMRERCCRLWIFKSGTSKASVL